MKNRAMISLAVLCLFLSSCFDVEETYNLSSDGSYSVAYNLDMSGFLGMANSFIPDSIKSSAAYTLKKDSTFNLSNIPDSVKAKLNANELNILSSTRIRTQMDLGLSVFKINLTTQGKSVEDLKYFLTNYSKAFQKSNVTDVILTPPSDDKTAKNSSISSEAFGGQEPDLPFNNGEYDFIITSKSFERKIRPELLLAANEKNAQLYEVMKGMDVTMKSTIIINLPRPALSVENPKAVLSADRKQFKLVIDMLEATAHPESLNFKVTY
jgi:hypothetical protein